MIFLQQSAIIIKKVVKNCKYFFKFRVCNMKIIKEHKGVLMMKKIISVFLSFIFVLAIVKADEKGYLQSAYDAMQAGEYKAAIVFYEKAIQSKDDYAPAWYGRGLAYAHLGKIKESINDFSKAVYLDANMSDAHYALGLSYVQDGNYASAISSFDKAIELDKTKSDYYYARGNSYKLNKQYDKALVDFSKAIDLDPNNGLPYYARGALHKLEGRGDASLKDLEKYLELRGNKDGMEKEVKRLIQEIREGRIN